jgi:putative flavoprotein involved in K+ transport
MQASEVVDLIDRFAVRISAPIRLGANVTSVRHSGDGYRVRSTHGDIQASTVVIASGACNRPTVPTFAGELPATIRQLTPVEYRNPEQLPDSGVLVVGASATGVQLASEIRRSGRPVTLSVGEHVRLPRTYRGRDVLWWMQAAGVWDQRYDEIDDITRARRLPSPQLVGSPERATLDLNALIGMGVELVGRWASVRDGSALFSGGLRNVVSLADLKLERLLDTFDDWKETHGPDLAIGPTERFEPTKAPRSPRWEVDLRNGEFGTVLWATGFRPDYSWLDVSVLDAKGRLRHDGGVVDSPGLYALGLPVLRRRKSTFIHGIEDDAREVISLLGARLDGTAPPKTAGSAR